MATKYNPKISGQNDSFPMRKAILQLREPLTQGAFKNSEGN